MGMRGRHREEQGMRRNRMEVGLGKGASLEGSLRGKVGLD